MVEKMLIEPQTKEKKQTSLEIATKYHQEFLLRASAEDLTNAINFYIDSIKENPNEASPYYRLAVLMYENKQIGIDTAIEQCKCAVKIDEKNPDARMYLGYFLSIKGEKEEANP